jgi:hypothetical protein
MSDYSEMYADQKRAEFLKRWEPDNGYPQDWNHTTRWWYARAKSAEIELQRMKSAVATLVGDRR